MFGAGSKRLWWAAVAAVAALAVACGSTSARSELPSWPTYGGSLTSSNTIAAGALTSKTARRLKARWHTQVSGTVWASPIVVRRSDGRRLVIVATETNKLYALDASSGKVVWSRSAGSPMPACGGTYGITSTPAVDGRAGVLYAASANGLLGAYRLADGRPVSGWPVRVITRTAVEDVWSAVRLIGGSLYLAVASYCDSPDKSGKPADGYLLRVDPKSRKVVGKFDVTPGPANLAGIWGWGGVSYDAEAKTLYTATGNAVVYRGGNLIEDAGHAERLLALSPSLRLLAESPAPPPTEENRGDEDFGSTPLLFQPSGCAPLVAANSKNGSTYVWRRGHLASGPVISLPIGPTAPNDPFLGQPVYLPSLRLLVVAQAEFGADKSRGVSAFRLNAGCSGVVNRWNLNIGGGPQAPPIAVGDVVVASAPATSQVAVVDAKTGLLLDLIATGAPVYAPLASDGSSIYVATTGGVVYAYTP